MKRLTFLVSVAAFALATGCRAKPTGSCESDKDCVAEHGVCVSGLCHECGRDTDCKSGFVCHEMRCEPAPAPVAQAPAPAPAPEPAPAADNDRCDVVPVHFGFNEASLDSGARDTVAGDLKCIKQVKRITVEGHCDERGTEEYNLQLGQRRADAVRKYLQGLGVPKAKIKTVSYGKTRPADPGHDEGAWAKNRRAELKTASSD